MDQAVIFQPFVATVLLTMVVWVYMYGRRFPFIFSIWPTFSGPGIQPLRQPKESVRAANSLLRHGPLSNVT
jgi:hypothetical protein